MEFTTPWSMSGGCRRSVIDQVHPQQWRAAGLRECARTRVSNADVRAASQRTQHRHPSLGCADALALCDARLATLGSCNCTACIGVQRRCSGHVRAPALGERRRTHCPEQPSFAVSTAWEQMDTACAAPTTWSVAQTTRRLWWLGWALSLPAWLPLLAARSTRCSLLFMTVTTPATCPCHRHTLTASPAACRTSTAAVVATYGACRCALRRAVSPLCPQAVPLYV